MPKKKKLTPEELEAQLKELRAQLAVIRKKEREMQKAEIFKLVKAYARSRNWTIDRCMEYIKAETQKFENEKKENTAPSKRGRKRKAGKVPEGPLRDTTKEDLKELEAAVEEVKEESANKPEAKESEPTETPDMVKIENELADLFVGLLDKLEEEKEKEDYSSFIF